MFILLDLYTKVCHSVQLKGIKPSLISWWWNYTTVDKLLYTTVAYMWPGTSDYCGSIYYILCTQGVGMSCIGKALCMWSVLDQWLESSVAHFMHMHIMALWLSGVGILPVTMSTRSGMSCIGKALYTWSFQDQGLKSSVAHFTHMQVVSL
jgi:hypothetical protein